MKAIVVRAFGNEDVLEYTTGAPCPRPGPGQALVRLYAAGVNPVDTYIRTGNYAMGVPALPYTPGRDGAGIVEEWGPGAEGPACGSRVFVAGVAARACSGTYAEYVVCDAAVVRPLPDATSFAEGAAMGTPGLAAANALFCRAKLRGGETVLVHGASGGVGTLAVQLARRCGAVVLGTAGTQDGMEMVRRLGAHMVFNHRKEGYLNEIRAATGGRGPQVILEMAAHANLGKDLGLLAKYGRVVIIGSRGPLELDPRLAMTAEAAVLGMTLGNMPPADAEANLSLLAAALEDGLRPVIEKELPLEEAPLAHRQVLSHSGAGKIVLRIG